MKIKSEVLEMIDVPAIRSQIAVDLGVGEQNIYRQLKANEDNGPLTKMVALEAISKISGVPVLEILEEVPAEVKEAQS
jgi:hypothetical protein